MWEWSIQNSYGIFQCCLLMSQFPNNSDSGVLAWGSQVCNVFISNMQLTWLRVLRTQRLGPHLPSVKAPQLLMLFYCWTLLPLEPFFFISYVIRTGIHLLCPLTSIQLQKWCWQVQFKLTGTSIESWADGSSVKSTGCSFRALWLGFQDLHGGS